MVELIVISAVVTVAVTAGWFLLNHWAGPQHAQLEEQNEHVREELWNFELRRRILAKQEQIDDLRGDWDTTMRCNMTASHLMTEQVIQTPPDAPVEELHQLMARMNTRHVLICEPPDCLQGVVSSRDLHQRRGRTAQAIMTANPITISPSDRVGKVLSIMLDKPISCLPVVDRGHLRGVLTTTDLLMALECLLEICEERLGSEALSG